MTNASPPHASTFSKRSLLDLLLVGLLVVGGVLAWQSGRERRRLETELARLRNLVQELDLVDPTKVHIRAIETNEPLHFAWRVYLPAGISTTVKSRFTLSGGSSWGSSTSTNPSHFIARVRFRKNERGTWELYEKFHNGSSHSTISEPRISELFDKHAAELVAEPLGADQLEVFDSTESRDLLRILLPVKLRDPYRAIYPPNDQPRFPEVMSISVGKVDNKQ